MAAIITVVRDPDGALGKHFAADGSKRSAVTISRGVAVQREVPTAQAMAAVLAEVQSDPHAAIILSEFPGVPVGQEFDLLSERELQAITGHRDVRGTLFATASGRYMTGRFIERVRASDWIMLDRDTDGQTPAHLGPQGLPTAAWIRAMDALLPGVSQAPAVCVPSASARVIRPDGQPVGQGNGHWFVQVAGCEDVEALKVAAECNAIKAGLAWPWHNKNGASSLRTICDLSVWTPGRLVFEGAPTAEAPLRVVPPQPQVINPHGQPLQVVAIPRPTADEFRTLTRLMGAEKVLRQDGRGGLDAYDLPLAALIETEDYGTLQVCDAVALMRAEGLDKLRCQTPFRESRSMAGVLRIGSDGKAALYDVGTGTTHWLSHADHASTIFSATPAAPMPVGAASNPAPNRFAAATRNLAAEQAKPYPNAIIHNLISEESLTVLWGPPGAGKSSVAATMARAVSTGAEFLGHPTQKCKVLYVSTEGSIRRRFAADGLDLPGVDILEEQIDLLAAGDVTDLGAHIAAQGYKMVVFDVLAQAHSGDENSTETMGAIVRAMNYLRATTRAAMLVVHHSNKAGDAIRGNSALLGAADNEIKALRVEGTDRRQLSVGKCRDGRDYRDLSLYEIEAADLGPDPDPIAPAGARLTAARVKWVDAADAVSARIASDDRLPAREGPDGTVVALGILKRQPDGVTEADWRTEYCTVSSLPLAIAKRGFDKIVLWLIQQKYIRSEIGPMGKVYKQSHIDEINSTSEFGRLLQAGFG